jgi:hypothetical protein
LSQALTPGGGEGEGLIERSAGRSFEDEFGFALQGSTGEGGALFEAIYDVVVQAANQDVCHGVIPYCPKSEIGA